MKSLWPYILAKESSGSRRMKSGESLELARKPFYKLLENTNKQTNTMNNTKTPFKSITIENRAAYYWITFSLMVGGLAMFFGTNQLNQEVLTLNTYEYGQFHRSIVPTNQEGYAPKDLGSEQSRIQKAEVTNYSRETCSSRTNCYTASGTTPEVGRTIACPRKYKFGTKVVILGHTYTCEDRLALKYDSRFDIWAGYSDEEYQQARDFGKQLLDVYILE